MNEDKVCALIEQHGLNGLCEFDGCLCCHFKLHQISVDISCRKSEQCVRIYCRSLDSHPSGLEKVAHVVLKELAILESGTAYRLRFCDYLQDHVNGRRANDEWVEEYSCCYCEKPRIERTAYLCSKCQSNPRALEFFPWTDDGFMVSV